MARMLGKLDIANKMIERLPSNDCQMGRVATGRKDWTTPADRRMSGPVVGHL